MAGGTIIIAAHNEASVIGRTLDALAEVARRDDVSVVVACNGCTDETAALARARQGVTVIDLPEPSKTAALRAGDARAGAGARIYLDADIVLTSRAAADVLHALAEGTVAGRPPHRFDVAGADRTVRRWYRVREQLPSISSALWGAGCYALSEQARARFAEFPDLVSDDLFIDSQFRPDEVSIIDTDPVVVTAPRKLADLLRIMQRSYRTQREVLDLSSAPLTLSSGQRGQARDLLDLMRRSPTAVPDVAVYVAVVAFAHLRARRAGAETRWERDLSSRDS